MLIVMLLGWPMASGSQDDPYPDIELPVFDHGYGLNRAIDPSQNAKILQYRIRVTQPPLDVIEFYDAFFIARGWISAFEICQRHWDDCQDTELADTGTAKQMYAAWRHPSKHLQAKLWLIYPQNAAKSGEVIVKCRVGWAN